ncbi:unnamed protein product [Mucor hiemalis]
MRFVQRRLLEKKLISLVVSNKNKKKFIFKEDKALIFLSISQLFGPSSRETYLALNGVYYTNEAAKKDYYGIDEDIWYELVKESMEVYSCLEGTVDDVSTFDTIIKSKAVKNPRILVKKIRSFAALQDLFLPSFSWGLQPALAVGI